MFSRSEVGIYSVCYRPSPNKKTSHVYVPYIFWFSFEKRKKIVNGRVGEGKEKNKILIDDLFCWVLNFYYREWDHQCRWGSMENSEESRAEVSQ